MIVGERTVFLPWWRAMLKELQAEQQRSWKAGDRVFVDAYLHRYPELATNPDVLCDLILGELVLRENGGEAAALDDYLRRYPQCANQLVQRYQASLSTALPEAPSPTIDMPQEVAATLDMSPPHSMETIQVDEAGQIAAQEQAFQQGVPKIPGYTVLSELGRGGMGVVYRAKQLSVNRDVALKVVRSDVLDTLPMATRNSTLARFRHEAHAAARLEHDNLVPVYDVGEAGSLRYYAMRFVDGVSLYDMLRNKALSNQEAARYIEPVARGLHYAHEKGVLHRDLKPHNIIVERKTDRPMLTDFGLAKFIEERNELTHAGDVMGTPSYMSPEQARDSGKVTASADVYSLGATLYHVLTSRPPFQAANVAETIRQVLDEEPVPPRRLNPAIDRDLETICLKCLQKEPARRYESSLALAEDLQRYLEHKPILARPAGMVERTWRWCKRNPRLAGTAALASLLLVFWITSMVSGYAKAVAARQRAHFLIDDVFTQISEEELLNQPGMQRLRGKLLSKALVHYQELLTESGGARWIQDEVAVAHYRIGVIRNEMGQVDEASIELATALELQEKLHQASPTDSRRSEALGDTFSALGRLYAQNDQFVEAAAQYARADEIRLKLADQMPEDQELQRKLASVQANLGLVELNQGQELRDRGQEKPGVELQTRGRAHIAQAQQRRLAILESDPESTAARRELAMGYFNLARFDSLDFVNLPEPRPATAAQAAIDNLREAVRHFELLDTKELANRSRLATAYRQLGGLLVECGDLEGAQKAYESARPLITVLALGNPDVLEYQVEYVGLAMIQGDMYEKLHSVPSALEAWMRARDGLNELLQRDRDNYQFRFDLATALDAMAEDYQILGQLPERIATLDSVLSELSKLIEQSPDDTELKKLRDWQSQVSADRESAQKTLDEPHGPGTASSNPDERADKNQ